MSKFHEVRRHLIEKSFYDEVTHISYETVIRKLSPNYVTEYTPFIWDKAYLFTHSLSMTFVKRYNTSISDIVAYYKQVATHIDGNTIYVKLGVVDKIIVDERMSIITYYAEFEE